MANNLTGRVALITGATRGIGAAVARRYAAEGAAVGLGHEPDPDIAAATADLATELTAAGANAVALGADLADPDGPAQLVDAARDALGSLDILVANAAAFGSGAFTDLSVAQWDRVSDVNARASWLLAKHAAPDLVSSGHGAIVTVTSVMVATGQPNAVHYTASKAAIVGLTRVLARELGPSGVRVNAVMPGAIRTEHEIETDTDADAVAARILPLQALNRRGTAEDLAGAFAFLAGDDARFITGQVICVDGGWVLW